MAEPKVIIGLETHVQLNTKSKLFCGCPTIGLEKPNTRVCDVCLGLPGTKPRLNKAVLEKAIAVALALNCKINKLVPWNRKSYFYPDMCKNYQITQYDMPLAYDGYLMLDFEGKKKKIRIRRIHIEEDPAKLIHVGGDITKAEYVLVDYNRSGVPLIEIVTEPDIESPQEARAYLSKLVSILEHLGVYDITNYVLKSDANVNITGTERTEVKNISGIKAVVKALSYEVTRHKNMLRRGVKPMRETRHYNPKTGLTHALRTKETEEDYGYIVDPDLSWISISSELIKQIKASLPELPDERAKRFVKDYGLNQEQANALINDKALADFYEECVKEYGEPVTIAKWIVTELLKSFNYHGITLRESNVKVSEFLELFKLMDEKIITARMAKELVKAYVDTSKSPKTLVAEQGLRRISKTEELLGVVKKVIKENAEAVKDYKSGQEKALHFLVGQVMKETKGQAEPNKVREIIKKKLLKQL